jgi:hypothetical protein
MFEAKPWQFPTAPKREECGSEKIYHSQLEHVPICLMSAGKKGNSNDVLDNSFYLNQTLK